MADAISLPSIPAGVFIPIFIFMGTWNALLGWLFADSPSSGICIVGGLTVYYLATRRRRRTNNNQFGAPELGLKVPCTDKFEKTMVSVRPSAFRTLFGTKEVKLAPSVQDELRHNIPLSAQPLPPSPTCPGSSKKKDSRPSTARSDSSSTFFRRPMRLLSKTERRTSAIIASITPHTSRPVTPAADRPIVKPGDPSWAAPTSWDVVPPPVDADGKTVHVPAVPMPAFLQAPTPLDPTEVDPDTFPIPRSMIPGAKSIRWSASQMSSFSGVTGLGRSSSIGGDSVWCACDLQDIAEEGGGQRHRDDGGRLSTGSSLHFAASKCRQCTARARASAAAGSIAQPALSAGHPSGQAAATTVRPSRKPRRVRKMQEEQQKNRTVVAGRLYTESAPATPRVSR